VLSGDAEAREKMDKKMNMMLKLSNT
jgi:hypothetical protein